MPEFIPDCDAGRYGRLVWTGGEFLMVNDNVTGAMIVFPEPFPMIVTESLMSRSPFCEESSLTLAMSAIDSVNGMPFVAAEEVIVSVPAFAFEKRMASRTEHVPVPVTTHPPA